MSEQAPKRMRMTDDVSVKVKVYSEKFGELKDFDGTPFLKQLPLMEVVDRHLAEKEEKAKTLLKEKEERLLTFVKTVFPTATQVVWKEKKKCTKTDIYFSLKIFVFVVEYEVCSLVWKYNFDLGDESSALASPELVREVNKARLPYNLNFFSQLAALAALEERETLKGTVQRLIQLRERLLERVADMPGVRGHPSDANFFLLEVLSADPKAVWSALARRGVLVRDGLTSYPQLERCLRVSVGSEEENEAFLHALGTALSEAGALVAGGRA